MTVAFERCFYNALSCVLKISIDSVLKMSGGQEEEEDKEEEDRQTDRQIYTQREALEMLHVYSLFIVIAACISIDL